MRRPSGRARRAPGALCPERGGFEAVQRLSAADWSAGLGRGSPPAEGRRVSCGLWLMLRVPPASWAGSRRSRPASAQRPSARPRPRGGVRAAHRSCHRAPSREPRGHWDLLVCGVPILTLFEGAMCRAAKGRWVGQEAVRALGRPWR